MNFETFLEICTYIGFVAVIALICTAVSVFASWFTHEVLLKKRQKKPPRKE